MGIVTQTYENESINKERETMNPKIKLAGTILLLIVLIAGSTLVYQNLKENYNGSINLVSEKK